MAALLVTVLGLSLPATAQVHRACSENVNDNGIQVGPPEFFDARELQSMLRQAQEQLAALNTIQQDPIQAALGALQGGETTESSFGLSATEVARPAPGADPVGDPAGTAATPPEQTADTAYSASYSLSARDLLAEQMQLIYQINNLRLLLSQSLTDRVDLTYGALPGSLARQPLLLGFQIDVDPDARHRRSVAEVRISLKLEEDPDAIRSRKDALRSARSCDSLSDSTLEKAAEYVERLHTTALFPAKNTYNTASLVKKAKNFGLGAIAGVVNLGIAGGKRSETFYLVQDVDTLAFEHPNRGPRTVEFGWQFRPVLGREVVDPGQRQVFALLNLPDFGAKPYRILDVEVRTHWRRMQRFGTRAKRTLSKDQFVGERSCTSHTLPVPSAATIHEALAPNIHSVVGQPIGGDKFLVTVEGENFLPGSQVLLGGRVLGDAAGLWSVGSEKIGFMVPIANLAKGEDLQLLSRYGELRTLVSPLGVKGLLQSPTKPKAQLSHDGERNDVARLTISDICWLPKQSAPPLMYFAGSAFLPRVQESSTHCNVTTDASPPIPKIVYTFEADIEVPRSSLLKDDRVLLTLPFSRTYGQESTARALLDIEYGDVFYASSFDALGPVEIKTSGKKSDTVKGKLYAIDGVNLKPCSFEIQIDPQQPLTPRERTSKCPDLPALDRLTFEIPNDELTGVTKLQLVQGAVTQLLATKPPPPPGPSDLNAVPAVVSKNDSVEIEVTGTKVSAIEEVRFEDKKLETRTEKGKFFVAIPRAITKEIGTVQLTVIGKNKSVHKVEFKVEARSADSQEENR